jgi:hypothetical protein
MTRHICDDCLKSVPNGKAHIGCVLFRLVAYCGTCWAIRQIVAAVRRKS